MLLLFRGCSDDIYGYDAEEELGQKDGEEGGEVAEDGVDGADFHEHDEAEGQRDAYGQVYAYAATAFAAGDAHADEGHDEDGQGVEEALVEFDFG